MIATFICLYIAAGVMIVVLASMDKSQMDDMQELNKPLSPLAAFAIILLWPFFLIMTMRRGE